MFVFPLGGGEGDNRLIAGLDFSVDFSNPRPRHDLKVPPLRRETAPKTIPYMGSFIYRRDIRNFGGDAGKVV